MELPPNGSRAAAEEKLRVGCVVDVHRIIARLDLERRLRASVGRLLLLLMCAVCMTASIYELHPTDEVARVHGRLRDKLGLQDGASSLATLGEVHAFALTFEGLSSALRATSPLYWCERRYLTMDWNATMRAPSRQCASPRQQALGIVGGMTNGSSDGVVGAQTIGASCEDDAEGLQHLTRGAIDACNVKLCSNPQTAFFCKKTCGYCPSFEYDPSDATFSGPLTLLPTVIFQTRWMQRKCAHFGNAYNRWVTRTVHGDTTWEDSNQCADRSGKLDDRSFVQGSGPGTEAHDFGGWPLKFLTRTFGSRPVYSVLLAQPAVDLENLMERRWLDSLTESVTVAGLAYAPEAELFTYVAVEFKVDVAGNLAPFVHMESYKDLSVDTQVGTRILVWLCLSVSLGFIGLLWSVLSAVRCRQRRTLGQALEAFTYLLLVALAIVIICLRESKSDDIIKQYDGLLKDWIGMSSYSDADREVVLSSFFKTATQLRELAWFMTSHRIACWAILHLLALQAFRYASTYPRVSVIATTFTKGLDEVCHAVFILAVIFVAFAGLAHWTFASQFKGYESLSSTLSLQLRWIIGRIGDGSSAGMGSSRMVLYRIYAVLFLVGLLWFSLYVILALVLFIVNAGREESEQNDSEFQVTRGILKDVVDCFLAPFTWFCRRWPSQRRLSASFTAAAAIKAPPPGTLLGRGVEVRRVYPIGPEHEQTLFCISAGSIVNFTGDAIVNAANEACVGGGGVDGAISRAGGPALAQARQKLPIVEGKYTRCPTGTAVVTIGGDLMAAKCIHAVGPDYRPECSVGRSPEDCDSLLFGAYVDAMERASEVNAKTLAFSLLSTGVSQGVRSLGSVLTAGVEGIRANAYPGLREVHMVCQKEAQLAELLTVCDFILGNGEAPQVSADAEEAYENPTPECLLDRLDEVGLRSSQSTSKFKVLKFKDESQLEEILMYFDQKCHGLALLPPSASGDATSSLSHSPSEEPSSSTQEKGDLSVTDVPGMTPASQEDLRSRVTKLVLDRLAIQPTEGKNAWDEVAATLSCDIVETIVQVIYEMFMDEETPTDIGDANLDIEDDVAVQDVQDQDQAYPGSIEQSPHESGIEDGMDSEASEEV
eukprot:TRINITY_DN61561_c0_g1_i1.p1 TRINITY_DN61561_c0_g1~~TRINITY_DN61561_c0_g1_i1.p1  ORF type:complete len:1108 (-),score=159.30 TRINITY_DN61561_c0_g1_i1:827-4150(-)